MPLSQFQFRVTFLGADGQIDQPAIVPTDNQLNQGSLSVVTVDEGGLSDTEFLFHFAGTAGRQDQPDIVLANNTLGVTTIIQEELVKGVNSEFQVNVETTNDQASSDVVIRPDGSFFVSWYSLGQDGDATGSFGKLYDANGDVLRDEFQLNTFTQGDQALTRAGVDAQGNLVVVWVSGEQDGDDFGVYGRRFGADGFAIGDEFLVNTLTGGRQFTPSVAVNGDGTFVVSFDSQAGEGGIHAQRFAADASKVGSEQQVSQFGSRNQRDAEIARSANGNYVVVWTDAVRDSDVSAGIYAQVFDVNNNPISGEFEVNEITDLSQRAPAVAIDDAGQFVVVWTSSGIDPVTNNAISTIRGRQFSANGTPLTSEFQISDGNVYSQSMADVDIDALTGNWVAAWGILPTSGDNADVLIRGKIYDANGVAQSPEFDVFTSVAGSEFDVRPRIAISPSGEFSVAGPTGELVDVFFGALIPYINTVAADLQRRWIPKDRSIPSARGQRG